VKHEFRERTLPLRKPNQSKIAAPSKMWMGTHGNYEISLVEMDGFKWYKISLWAGTERMSWDEVNSIKNSIIGKDKIAIEIYPKLEDLQDGSDVRHLFVLPDEESEKLPNLKKIYDLIEADKNG